MNTTRMIGTLLASWLLFSAGCKTTAPVAGNSRKGIHYLALGDSYTIGESVDENERYPEQLAAALGKDGISVASTQIIARTGWTTAELAQGIRHAAISRNYDLVTLLIGVNNEFRHRSTDEYQAEFIQLVQQSIGFAGGKKDRVFVLSIPDYGFTPYGADNRMVISPRIDAFNAINKRIADSLQVHYIDITPVSRNGLDDPALVATDGLHPSGKQYAKWVAAMKSAVEKALR